MRVENEDDGRDDCSDPSRVARCRDLSWEEVETGAPGQLNLYSAPLPTVGERVFVQLAREWRTIHSTHDNAVVQREASRDLEMSCLWLAVEWGREFTSVAWEEVQTNRTATEQSTVGANTIWPEALIWSLCSVPRFSCTPTDTSPVETLTQNLGHHTAWLRCWMMEIGWVTRSWLNPSKAMPPLLDNLATTLRGAFMAAGLAVEILQTEDDFWKFARAYVPRASYEKQYASRLTELANDGVYSAQTMFWREEARLRRRIEHAILGRRLAIPPPSALGG